MVQNQIQVNICFQCKKSFMKILLLKLHFIERNKNRLQCSAEITESMIKGDLLSRFSYTHGHYNTPINIIMSLATMNLSL